MDFRPFEECGEPRTSHYANCGYDTAGKMLSHILVNMIGSTISELKPKDPEWQTKGVLRTFEQNEFHDFKLFQNSNFKPEGFVFYPNQCFEDVKCKIHINMHGCGGQGLTLVMFGGYNNWAVSNDLIMLYP